MVDEQQLEGALLALARQLRRHLGTDDHALGDGRRARGERLLLALDLDEALAARAERVEQRMVAEPWHLDAHLFGGADDEGVLRDRDLGPVNCQSHGVSHAGAPAAA